jgi:putative ABC transport system ATP-binding protein
MLLELRRLRKEYTRDNAAFTAVGDASFSMGKGELVCVTGRSGSGKSTLLNMIAGLLKPSSGSIAFEGRELSKLKDADMSFLRNTGIGYIPQGHNILANFSVLDNIMLPFYLHKRDGDPAERARHLLGQMGISHLENSYPAWISGGELRRVEIARSLINKPLLLIADEPTGNLDPETTEDVMRLFARIVGEGISVLIVTHDVDVVRHNSRRFYMESGTLTEN